MLRQLPTGFTRLRRINRVKFKYYYIFTYIFNINIALQVMYKLSIFSELERVDCNWEDNVILVIQFS